ncbi:MAG: hypothetical protein OIF54_14435, partial [Cohaesibacter sp.]|nr:hypothetical protein [Cohaesibacter sp.]
MAEIAKKSCDQKCDLILFGMFFLIDNCGIPRGPLGKLALVTPANLSEEEIEALPAPVRKAKAAGNTVMFLPLRSKSDALAVDAELHQIAAQHLCLAFLRRLRRLQLRFLKGSMILQRSEADVAKLYFPGASNLVAVRITEFTEAG